MPPSAAPSVRRLDSAAAPPGPQRAHVGSSNLQNLSEAKREILSFLGSSVAPVIIAGMYDIVQSCHAARQRERERDPGSAPPPEAEDEALADLIRSRLLGVPDWSAERVSVETNKVLSACSCLPKCLKAVIVTNVSILLSVRTRKPTRPLRVRVPSADRFVHHLYMRVASAVLEDELGLLETRNRSRLRAAVQSCIEETVQQLTPVESVVDQYFDDQPDENMDAASRAPSSRPMPPDEKVHRFLGGIPDQDLAGFLRGEDLGPDGEYHPMRIPSAPPSVLSGPPLPQRARKRDRDDEDSGSGSGSGSGSYSSSDSSSGSSEDTSDRDGESSGEGSSAPPPSPPRPPEYEPLRDPRDDRWEDDRRSSRTRRSSRSRGRDRHDRGPQTKRKEDRQDRRDRRDRRDTRDAKDRDAPRGRDGEPIRITKKIQPPPPPPAPSESASAVDFGGAVYPAAGSNGGDSDSGILDAHEGFF